MCKIFIDSSEPARSLGRFQGHVLFDEPGCKHSFSPLAISVGEDMCEVIDFSLNEDGQAIPLSINHYVVSVSRSVPTEIVSASFSFDLNGYTTDSLRTAFNNTINDQIASSARGLHEFDPVLSQANEDIGVLINYFFVEHHEELLEEIRTDKTGVIKTKKNTGKLRDGVPTPLQVLPI
ncbi:MAG: hypothetical protein AAGI37_11655 [Planctomycetota bacterium]